MDSGLLSRWCMCINSHWCSKLCKVKNSLKIIISHQGFFFFLPIFCSFTKSWLWIKSCQATGVLWHVTVGTETDQKYLCALEWGSEQNKSPASYLVSRAQMQFYHIWITSAYPPRSPVLEVFLLWVVLNREDLLPSPLVHPFLHLQHDGLAPVCALKVFLQIFSFTFLDNY